jgi:hypothetical protein
MPDAFRLFAPTAITAGALLAGALVLSRKRRAPATLRAYGVRLGIVGLFLLLGPSVLVGAFGSTSRGLFWLVVAIDAFGPGICLLVAAVVLFVKSGEFS